MTTPKNLIKARLRGDAVQIGVWLGMGATVPTEIAGAAGFDWAMVDCEHGVHGVDRMRDSLVALQSVGCASGVRVADNQSWMIKQALDCGAQTILVPMVNTVAEAQKAVQSTFYPPVGARGMASGVVRASGYGADADYVAQAGAQICLMVQAETRQAVENVDEIAALDGVDCIFVGPSDLAADMGYHGDSSVPEVQEAIAHVLARARAAGKGAAMFCMSPAELPKYRDMGANFLAVASDVVSFAAAMRGRVAEAKDALGQT